MTLGAATVIAALAGCMSVAPPPPTPTSSPSATPSATPTPEVTPTAEAAPAVVGAVVRFSSARTSVDVTIGIDSPATRDFLAQLPTTMVIEDFAGSEKIGYPPRPLAFEGSPGSDPENGHLIYYSPWGNVGFYYDASGVGYSDATLHLGTYAATPDQLALLEGDVTVTRVG